MDPREKNRLMNQYMREAAKLSIGSPYRMGEYATARLKGKTPEQALAIAKKRP